MLLANQNKCERCQFSIPRSCEPARKQTRHPPRRRHCFTTAVVKRNCAPDQSDISPAPRGLISLVHENSQPRSISVIFPFANKKKRCVVATKMPRKQTFVRTVHNEFASVDDRAFLYIEKNIIYLCLLQNKKAARSRKAQGIQK